MIEAATAQALANQLRGVEDRLGRLLTSGWRQAAPEAAELRHDAEEFAAAGLPELAARLEAVAEAGGAAEALHAIALATSACRLLRARLPAEQVPDGWTALAPPRKAREARTEALVPVSRLLLNGRDVWVCTRPNRNQLLLVEPPFPLESAPEPAAAPAAPSGMFGRLRRQIGQALGGGETAPPSVWLRRRLGGTLRWQAQYPVGSQGDAGYYSLDDPIWVPDAGEQDTAPLRQMLARDKLRDGTPLIQNSGGFRIRELQRDDPASYVWLDPSAAEAFATAPTEQVWAIAWMEGAAIVPVALLTPSGRVNPARLTHLIPGAPSDVISTSR